MLGKKQITAKNAKKKPRLSFVCFAFLAVTMQFMGAMSDEGKQLPQAFLSAIICSMIGVRIISMASPIFPPGTTFGLRRDMKESCSMESR